MKVFFYKDVLFDGFDSLYSKTEPIKEAFEKCIDEHNNGGLSIKEMDDLLGLCYFMIRNAHMAETKLSTEDRTKYFLPLAYAWVNRIVSDKIADEPIWMTNVCKIIEEFFPDAYKILLGMNLQIVYSQIPYMTVDNDKKILVSINLMPFLLQLNYTYAFFNKFNDETTYESEVNQKLFPLMLFQSDPVSIQIASLPVIFGVSESDMHFAQSITHFQICFMILHELGHTTLGLMPDSKVDLNINGSDKAKELFADIHVYSIIENMNPAIRLQVAVAAITLFSFLLEVESFKNKRSNIDNSQKKDDYIARISLAMIVLRSAVSDLLINEIDVKSYDAVQTAAIRYLDFAFIPLGVVQNTLSLMTSKELNEYITEFTPA